MLAFWKKSHDQPRQRIKKQRHYFANKGPSSQISGFSSSHVWMWELDYKESWAPKNWCFWTVVWRRLFRVPWTARRSNQSILKEISPEYSLEGLMVKLKLQYFGHLMQRTDAGKDTDAWKDWGQEEKGTTEDEMVGWYHWLDGHEFEQALGVGDEIQPSHPLSFPSPPTFFLSQHQGLFKWVSSKHQVAKILELQLQHQSFQSILRVHLL